MNLHTKESTWTKPTEPAPGGGQDAPPGAPPPSYSAGPNAPQASDQKRPLSSNNPYGGSGSDSDAELARRLQAEEDARAGRSPRPADRGAAESYYSGGGGPQPGGPGSMSSPNNYPPNPTSPDGGQQRGFLGKLLGKNKPQQQQNYGGYPQQGYPQQGYPPQGYPQPGYGPPQGYGGYPPQGGYYGQPQPMYVQQQPGRRPGGGMGAGGAAALGLGGGLLGGMLLGEAMDGGDDGGGDGGGDFGGDGGGGDF